MPSKPYLIATASDKKYGDFLIEEWLESILDNVNIKKIQILVLDYGLTKAQRFYLEKHKVIVSKCNRDGHVVNIRFRDLNNFLKAHYYEQILTCDGGDIIFQDDISHLFEEHQDQYRAVCEDLAPFFDYFINTDYFYKEDIKEIKDVLLLKRMINAGLIIAPYDKMKHLCEVIIKKTKDISRFGPDQILVNYVLHKEGFVALPTKYNFIPVTCLDEFYIKDSFFYDKNENKIPVVHNAGNLDYFRAIENFGYNKDHNILKEDVLKTLRTFYSSLHIINKPKKEFMTVSKKVENFLKNVMNDVKENINTEIEDQKKQFLNLIKSIENLTKKNNNDNS
ncbi:MAG: hypothetical protein KatS3mg129_2424 [Leptospiraceae bacterium]|nr:MAG: hypothetical protein KatS3mg129_2424 [Leptospiraceae bacterium]